MASMTDWRIFLEWEQKACHAVDPRKSVVRLHREIEAEWQRKPNRAEYIGALRAVQTCQRDVRKYAAQVARTKKKADRARLHCGKSTTIETQRTLDIGLRDLLDHRADLVVALHRFYTQQQHTQGDIATSKCTSRSLEYMRSLLEDAESAETRTKIALRTCRQAQRVAGRSPSLDSIEWTPTDEAAAPGKGPNPQRLVFGQPNRVVRTPSAMVPQDTRCEPGIPPQPLDGAPRLPGLDVYDGSENSDGSIQAQDPPAQEVTTRETKRDAENVEIGARGDIESRSSQRKRRIGAAGDDESSKRQKSSEQRHKKSGCSQSQNIPRDDHQAEVHQEHAQSQQARRSSVPCLIDDSDIPSVAQPFNERLGGRPPRQQAYIPTIPEPTADSVSSTEEPQTRQPSAPGYDPTAPQTVTPAFERPKDLGKAAKDLGFGSPEGIDGHWNFLDSIGEGKFGQAGLWVQYNSEARIVNRMIVKDTWLKSTDWPRRKLWHDQEARIPMEVHMHQLLASLPRAWPVAGFLSWSLHEERRLYRIYMPYYPHGDLGKMIREYAKLEGALDEQGNEISALIPARVIWCIFETLAAAACLMKDGAFPDESAPDGWEGEMLHRDIKPINVFLDVADPDKWRSIPLPKLGDFGLAVHKVTPGISNSRDMIGTGTLGYQAPEQMKHTHPDDFGRFRLSSKSDVYSIGKTILCLMNLQYGERVGIYGYEDVPIPSRVRRFYPGELVGLLEQCLLDDPRDRIAADELLRAITALVATSRDGVDSIPLKYQSWNEGQPLRVKADTYAAFAR